MRFATRLFTAAVLFSATALSASCGSESTTAVVTSVAGTWNLTAVNGRPLPYVYKTSDPKLELIDRQYVFTSTGAFTFAYTVRATELDGSVSTGKASDSGTSSLANNVLTITYKSDGSSITATVSGNTMTIEADATLTFTKQ